MGNRGDGTAENFVASLLFSKPKRSAIMCEHANEMPAQCPCDDDCYCKENSCKNRKSKLDENHPDNWTPEGLKALEEVKMRLQSVCKSDKIDEVSLVLDAETAELLFDILHNIQEMEAGGASFQKLNSADCWKLGGVYEKLRVAIGKSQR